MAGREGGVELSDPFPLLGDQREVDGATAALWDFLQGPVVALGIGAVDTPVVQAADTRAEAHADHGEVIEAGAVGLLQHFVRHGEALSVAGRRLAFSPVAGGVQAGDAIHDRGEGGVLVVLDEAPVADMFELFVRDVGGDLLHGEKTEIAALGEVVLMRLSAENDSSSETATSTSRSSRIDSERQAITRSINPARAFCLAGLTTRRNT